MATMNESTDLILDEIHQTRSALIKLHGGIAGLAAFLRKEEADADREVVNPTLNAHQEKSASKNRPSRGVKSSRQRSS